MDKVAKRWVNAENKNRGCRMQISKHVFRALALGMVSMGLVMGAAFPGFVMGFGIPKSTALT
ncbi:MAG TPA: hypothetical protein PLD79_09445, partial [Halothiobacillus sp.]|nr:hypothetical protein [Halothiobacillus sp.]